MTTTTTTEAVTRPILFSGPMIRALLAGTKTQTRRIVKPQLRYSEAHKSWMWPSGRSTSDMNQEIRETTNLATGAVSVVERSVPIAEWLVNHRRCPYRVGEQLWVREAFCVGYEVEPGHYTALPYSGCESFRRAFYRATDPDPADEPQRRWRSPIHMPRWASRITLEIDAVRVERAHSITDADVRAEGVDPAQIDKWRKWLDPRDVHGMAYGELFDSINGKGAWAKNPWVWVLSFHRVESPRA